MKDEIKSEAYPKVRNGYVHQCAYYGEDAGTGKFCKTCKTKKGREDILAFNVEILSQLRTKGFCKNEVLLPAA
jgi:hypothetical protein